MSEKRSGLDKFKHVWNKVLDEDTKEILAGAIYLLNRTPAQLSQSYSIVRYPFTEERLKLLSELAEYTGEN